MKYCNDLRCEGEITISIKLIASGLFFLSETIYPASWKYLVAPTKFVKSAVLPPGPGGSRLPPGYFKLSRS